MAGSWLIASVYIDLDDADVVGDRLHVRQEVADPGAVLAAAAAGPQRGDDRDSWPGREVMPVRRWVPLTDGGILCRDACCRVGLLSNRSTWEKPSVWKRQRTRLALGAKWGRRASRADVAAPAARRLLSPRSEPRAARPSAVAPASPRNVRRVEVALGDRRLR